MRKDRSSVENEANYQIVDWNSKKNPDELTENKLRIVQRTLENGLSNLRKNSNATFHFQFKLNSGDFLEIDHSNDWIGQVEIRRPARLDLSVASKLEDFPALEAYADNATDFSNARQYISRSNINNIHVESGFIVHTFAFPGENGRVQAENAWQVVKPDRSGTGNTVGFGVTDTLLLDLMMVNTKEYLSRRGLVRLSLDEVMAEARSLNWQAPIRRAVERVGALLGLGI